VLPLLLARSINEKKRRVVARNQENKFEWVDMSTRVMMFQWASTIKIQLRVFAKYNADNIVISSNVICFPHYIADKLLFWR
jgi:hypothetical protein